MNKDYRIIDLFPGKELDEIGKYSDRANSYFARKISSCEKQDAIRISGAIFMIDGMEYHYSNFKKISDEFNKDETVATQLKHEISAYLNCLYAYDVFLRSEYAGKQKKFNDDLKLRHKQFGHRQIDRKNNNLEFENYCRIEYSVALGTMTKGNHLIIQYIDPDNKKVNDFDLLTEHANIIEKVYDGFCSIPIFTSVGGIE